MTMAKVETKKPTRLDVVEAEKTVLCLQAQIKILRAQFEITEKTFKILDLELHSLQEFVVKVDNLNFNE